jgi:acyl-CoA thioesterase FadM
MDEDVEYAVGSRVLVCVDPKTKKPTPWSDAFRQRIAPFIREAAPADVKP